MIVRIKFNGRVQFLALHSNHLGEWIPISHHTCPSREEAHRVCLNELSQRLAELGTELTQVGQNAARLLDEPSGSDSLRVQGIKRKLDEDGTLTISEWEAPPSFESILRKIARDICEGDGDDSTAQEFARVLGVEQLRLDDVYRCVLYSLEYNPIGLLASLERYAPDRLGEFASDLVHLYRLANHHHYYRNHHPPPSVDNSDDEPAKILHFPSPSAKPPDESPDR